MKNLPLSLQIWLVFAVITLCISILLCILLPMTLRDFFTKEIYATIESAQVMILDRFANEISRETWESGSILNRRPPEDIRTVNHFIILKKDQVIISPGISMPLPPSDLSDVRIKHPGFMPPQELSEKILNEIKNQTKDSQRYSAQVGDRKMFYVATKGKVLGDDVYLISYMWDTYREDLVKTLFKRLSAIMGLAFILSWLPSLGLARYLTRPLVTLEKRVEKLADRDWQEPIKLERNDEIGRLGKSVEQLRQQLVLQDEAQQSFLQNISHELKTPVMVIQSYIQAIKDGIFPKGDLNRTLQVIEEESDRLQKLIHNLLYLTKLDYLATHKPTREIFEIDKLLKHVVERLRWHRKELDWSLKLSPIKINGDIEQWRVVLENLLDNQIRYANSKIDIDLTSENETSAMLHIYNDGPSIEPEIMETLFQKYNKGYKGKSGLGLAIVNRIVSLHGGKIRVENEKNGVSFYILVPKVT
ncbi:Sensor histidine kinase CssS [Tepidanaerobacter acetatoxydans Re1]|uniref:histidine kinase n=1 Tax=Tepidanaerobacter acetatoxydans (strain DSM 21804 / JCM 16047 / Re1) TaxID=1209989 RepID=F4LWX6_TEPAE|nr:HAMP domain-containing sensor histidine kinase [Tepidanaerobacter acetatoxydans]AEE90954.1 integral membrane sensor signal transduction histidine kinase [Tepidanaerobacter acetatoxydans Re1]CCP25545.1 Sensor histidine kinase CssS [Tepidanaerobacter acetatoxydans Re1]